MSYFPVIIGWISNSGIVTFTKKVVPGNIFRKKVLDDKFKIHRKYNLYTIIFSEELIDFEC